MNKTAIKKFAIEARDTLLKAVKQQAYEYEITADGENIKSLSAINGHLLTNEQKEQRRALIERIEAKGYENVMEEAAYTWFNRFIALRYMEVNGFLPSRVRVFTDEDGKFKPEIMKEAMTVEIDGLDRNKVLDLLEKQNNEELYKYLLITQCNALGEGLPKMFEQISDWTELLFPPKLLRDDSVIGKMVNEIPEEDFTDAVQIIGWMYQYYNTELKDDTFAKLKKNIKISKERIPAATQLFTPDWIVRYMVENSLGRIYIGDQLSVAGGQSESERIEAEKAIAEQMGWKYYLPEAEQTPEVRAELNKLITDHSSLTTLKVIDPCMGSGHILVYAFDVFMQIYMASGWSERDAAKSIVENNLYGLDIDDRAGQLAYFAVMMKARKYNRRALAGGAAGIIPNVYAIQESNHISTMAIDDFCNRDEKVKAEMDKLIYQMCDAKEYGSILNITGIDFDLLFARCDETFDEVHFHQNEINEDIIPLIKIAHIMSQKYDVVITNPPYMGGSGMSAKLVEFVKKNYPDSKSDLFAVFIERCAVMLKQCGYQAMITQHAWMFLSSYEKLREKLLTRDTVNMAHLGARAFEEIGGEVVQTTSFVFRNIHTKDFQGTYCRLIDPTTQNGKEEMFLSGENRYYSVQSNFSKIPGSPIAYWVSRNIVDVFSNNPVIDSIAMPRQGLATGDNNKMLRLWHEIDYNRASFNSNNIETLHATPNKRYIPYNKGGSYRKWFGNIEYLIKFDKSSYDYLLTVGNHLPSRELYFKESITWSKVTSGGLSMRYVTCGSAFDVAGCSIFAQTDLKYLLSLCNSTIMGVLIRTLSQTMNYEVGTIKAMPVKLNVNLRPNIEQLTDACIDISKKDWDSFETSWDFKKHPLI